MSKQNNNVLVYRKYILPYSETFIADQGRFLEKYKAIYAGLVKDSKGLGLISDLPQAVLEDYSSNINLSKLAYRLGILPGGWLKEITNLKPDIIHAHFLNDGIDVLRLKNRLNLPLVTTVHGHDITKKEKTALLQKNRKQFFSEVDKIVAVSDYIYRKALDSGCPEEKLIKHSIGIDLEKFTQQKNETEQPEILFVGRLAEKKGCIYLLQAMARLKSKYPDLKLTIVGDGGLAASLKEYSIKNQLNVNFVGVETPEKIRDRLSKTWLFAAPSITADNGDAEGLGMVFLEAQALNTPVVSYASGGVVEAIEDGVTGLLSQEKDVQALAESIDFFLESEEERRLYGERGRSRVESLFDIRKQCRLLENIYDSLR